MSRDERYGSGTRPWPQTVVTWANTCWNTTRDSDVNGCGNTPMMTSQWEEVQRARALRQVTA